MRTTLSSHTTVRWLNWPSRQKELHWLNSVGDNLSTQSKHYWKYVSKCKKNDHILTQIKSGGKLELTVEAFSDHILSTFNSFSPTKSPSIAEATFSGFVNVLSISDILLPQQVVKCNVTFTDRIRIPEKLPLLGNSFISMQQ